MKSIKVNYRGFSHEIHYKEPIQLSTRLNFTDGEISIYGVPPAEAKPLNYGGTIASMLHGGPCNAYRIDMAPHCHGTHTECIGHILPEVQNVADLNIEPLIAATLIRVQLERRTESTDNYNASACHRDWLITRASIDKALRNLSNDYLEALIIATAPCNWKQNGNHAPYFSHQAIERIVELGVQHLLVDIPSIDRLDDGGQMDNHHCFWGIKGSSPPKSERRHSTITELIHVPSHVSEGYYFLTLQLPDLAGDALPSRPELFTFSS